MSAQKERSWAGGTAGPGFTLIELLIAMAILLVIVMMTAQIFHQVTMAWDTGARKAELNMTGRAVVDLIARDLEQAVCDSSIIQSGGIPYFNVSPGVLTDGGAVDFVMSDAEPTAGTRTIRWVSYTYYGGLSSQSPKTIRRISKLWKSNAPYTDINSSGGSGCWTNESDGFLCGTQRIEQLAFSFPPNDMNVPPRYVDVKVEVGQPQDIFVSNTMSYTARAYLQFRNRYVFD